MSTFYTLGISLFLPIPHTTDHQQFPFPPYETQTNNLPDGSEGVSPTKTNVRVSISTFKCMVNLFTICYKVHIKCKHQFSSACGERTYFAWTWRLTLSIFPVKQG